MLNNALALTTHSRKKRFIKAEMLFIIQNLQNTSFI